LASVSFKADVAPPNVFTALIISLVHFPSTTSKKCSPLGELEVGFVKMETDDWGRVPSLSFANPCCDDDLCLSGLSPRRFNVVFYGIVDI
jgi:hypothetical protein